MTPFILRAIMLILLALNCRSSHADLTTTLWDVSGVQLSDGVTWNDSLLRFTSQTPSGTDFQLQGHFDWFASNGAFGRETFTGTLFADSSLALTGTGIGPIPGIGGPSGIGNADYFATLSNDGSQLTNGTWTAVGGGPVGGTWSAVAIPEPSSFFLLTTALVGITLVRHRIRS